MGALRQRDTYFKTQAGRLKLREFGDGSAQLIPYVKTYEAAPMKSDYAVLKVDDPSRLKSLLDTTLGIEFEAVYEDNTGEGRSRETADLMSRSYVDYLSQEHRR